MRRSCIVEIWGYDWVDGGNELSGILDPGSPNRSGLPQIHVALLFILCLLGSRDWKRGGLSMDHRRIDIIGRYLTRCPKQTALKFNRIK